MTHIPPRRAPPAPATTRRGVSARHDATTTTTTTTTTTKRVEACWGFNQNKLWAPFRRVRGPWSAEDVSASHIQTTASTRENRVQQKRFEQGRGHVHQRPHTALTTGKWTAQRMTQPMPQRMTRRPRTAVKTGENGSASRKHSPITTAVSPVRPPTTTPAKDSPRGMTARSRDNTSERAKSLLSVSRWGRLGACGVRRCPSDLPRRGARHATSHVRRDALLVVETSQ